MYVCMYVCVYVCMCTNVLSMAADGELEHKTSNMFMIRFVCMYTCVILYWHMQYWCEYKTSACHTHTHTHVCAQACARAGIHVCFLWRCICTNLYICVCTMWHKHKTSLFLKKKAKKERKCIKLMKIRATVRLLRTKLTLNWH